MISMDVKKLINKSAFTGRMNGKSGEFLHSGQNLILRKAVRETVRLGLQKSQKCGDVLAIRRLARPRPLGLTKFGPTQAGEAQRVV
jgi:hypothetical protein